MSATTRMLQRQADDIEAITRDGLKRAARHGEHLGWLNAAKFLLSKGEVQQAVLLINEAERRHRPAPASVETT